MIEEYIEFFKLNKLISGPYLLSGFLGCTYEDEDGQILILEDI